MTSWFDNIAPGLIFAQDRAYYPHEDSLGPDPRVCPPIEYCFRGLELVPPSRVRVVILGQDPYHTPGKASGLAFGYHPNYLGPLDSSLDNIMRELGVTPEYLRDLGRDGRKKFLSLEHWASQGVLLLNTRLTVLEGQPLSHAYRGPKGQGREKLEPLTPGWEKPIQEILQFLNEQAKESIVWLLWGHEAKRLAAAAGVPVGTSPSVFCYSHPCRFSHTSGNNPFTGSRCFEKVNKRLEQLGQEKIQWT